MPVDMQTVAFVAVSIVFAIALIGYFTTKAAEHGRLTPAAIILMLVLYAAFAAFSMGKLEAGILTNLLFAAAGYAGGLMTSKSG